MCMAAAKPVTAAKRRATARETVAAGEAAAAEAVTTAEAAAKSVTAATAAATVAHGQRGRAGAQQEDRGHRRRQTGFRYPFHRNLRSSAPAGRRHIGLAPVPIGCSYGRRSGFSATVSWALANSCNRPRRFQMKKFSCSALLPVHYSNCSDGQVL